jgi:intracellular sulfur oxidation DsrE/DsrF family protein
MTRFFSFLLAFGMLALPLASFAADAPPAQPKAKLLFVTTTRLEDIGTLSSSFRHALAATKSEHVSDVVWIGYGRAIVALDPTVSAVPDSVRQHAAAAKAGGVRLVACAQALKKYDIDPAKLQPKAEVVANAIGEVARLVAQGYQVINY